MFEESSHICRENRSVSDKAEDMMWNTRIVLKKSEVWKEVAWDEDRSRDVPV